MKTNLPPLYWASSKAIVDHWIRSNNLSTLVKVILIDGLYLVVEREQTK